MKKIFASGFIAALATLCLSACGGASKPEFTANVMGVDPILLCLPAGQIPASSPGLYDAFVAEEVKNDYEGDYTVLHFTLKGAPVMDAWLFNNEVGQIEVMGRHIGSPEGICPGMKVKELFAKGGRGEVGNDGRFTISLGGLNFIVSGLKSAGEMKVQNAYATGMTPQIDAKDFESGAVVERILIF